MEFWPQYLIAALFSLKYVGNMTQQYLEYKGAKMWGGFFGVTVYWGLVIWLLAMGGFWK